MTKPRPSASSTAWARSSGAIARSATTSMSVRSGVVTRTPSIVWTSRSLSLAWRRRSTSAARLYDGAPHHVDFDRNHVANLLTSVDAERPNPRCPSPTPVGIGGHSVMQSSAFGPELRAIRELHQLPHARRRTGLGLALRSALRTWTSHVRRHVGRCDASRHGETLSGSARTRSSVRRGSADNSPVFKVAGSAARRVLGRRGECECDLYSGHTVCYT
jgi:hypothetical protein